MRTVVPFIALVFVSGCAIRLPERVFSDVPGTDVAVEPRSIVAGDHIEVPILLSPSRAVVVEVTVDGDGFIELPEIGKLHVAGMKPSQFDNAVTAEYKKRGITCRMVW